MGLKKLFEGSDSENDDVSKISNIEVEEQYAKRYEHKKKRVALERLHELEKKGLIQSPPTLLSPNQMMMTTISSIPAREIENSLMC
nr:hypothetical protein CFP56_42640 [Quercus suber]